jgi:hypothetical protein
LVGYNAPVTIHAIRPGSVQLQQGLSGLRIRNFDIGVCVIRSAFDGPSVNRRLPGVFRQGDGLDAIAEVKFLATTKISEMLTTAGVDSENAYIPALLLLKSINTASCCPTPLWTIGGSSETI